MSIAPDNQRLVDLGWLDASPTNVSDVVYQATEREKSGGFPMMAEK
jgi:hypothetical protein